MQQLANWRIPYLSFFSKDIYREVCLARKGTLFGYLFLLIAISWAGIAIQTHLKFTNYVNNDLDAELADFPVITIIDGNLSIEEPQPCFITIDNKKIVIDTSGVNDHFDDEVVEAVLTRTHFVHRKNAIEHRSYSFESIEEFTVDSAKIKGWFGLAKLIVAPALYFFGVIGVFLWKMLQITIYAAIGLIFASILNTERTFIELIRLSVVAATPAIVVSFFLELLDIQLPWSNLFYFLLSMGYLYFGVKVSAENGTQQGMDPAENVYS